MPTIRTEMIKGRSVEQMREFADAVSRQAARILDCPPEVVDVVFQGVERHDWAVGGKLASEK